MQASFGNHPYFLPNPESRSHCIYFDVVGARNQDAVASFVLKKFIN
jgi:hypothetical protein